MIEYYLSNIIVCCICLFLFGGSFSVARWIWIYIEEKLMFITLSPERGSIDRVKMGGLSSTLESRFEFFVFNSIWVISWWLYDSINFTVFNLLGAFQFMFLYPNIKQIIWPFVCRNIGLITHRLLSPFSNLKNAGHNNFPQVSLILIDLLPVKYTCFVPSLCASFSGVFCDPSGSVKSKWWYWNGIAEIGRNWLAKFL